MEDSKSYVKFEPNESFLEALLNMGISEPNAQEALFCTANESIEAAISYVFNNLPGEGSDEANALCETGQSGDYEDDRAKQYKMTFVVNTALKMGIGKISAQVAHACLGLYRDMRVRGDKEDALNEWDYFGEKKIVLKGNNTEHLEELFHKAREQNVCGYLVSDAGHTQIPPGSVTVLSLFGEENEEPEIDLNDNELKFFAKGVGARGLHNYSVSVGLHSCIRAEESTHKIIDNRVEFTLIKAEKGWWPRLLKTPQKPIWLKIDHDRFQSEDMEEEESPNVLNDYKDVYDELQKEEIGYRKEDLKKVYLSIYNLLMYVGFMYVIIVLSVRYLKSGPSSFPGTYAAVGPAVCFLTLLQFLEVMHSIFGYVKTGWKMPLLQSLIRTLVAVFMLELEPRLQTMPMVFFLFVTWSLVEVIRYPYYMSRLLRREHGVLTWLRYTIWVILYPIGFICEGVIVFRNIIFLDKDNRWSFEMDFPMEFTLRVSHILRVYLLLFSIPTLYVLMAHMYQKRKAKLGPFPVKKAKKLT